MDLDPCLRPLTDINLKLIKDLNVRPEMIKLLEEKIGMKLLDMGLGNDFLDMTPKAQSTKSKINKGEYINYKALHSKRNKVK